LPPFSSFPSRRADVPPDALRRRTAALPPSPNSSAAIEKLTEAADRRGERAQLDDVLSVSEISAFLGSALGDCPYLFDLASKDLASLNAILNDVPEKRVAARIDDLGWSSWMARPEAMSALRRAKQDVALTLGLGDLAGALPLEAVTASLTAFADVALQAALRFALADEERAGRWSGGEPAGFFILAMGKYGAGELNYSSDIDLIAMFDPAAPGPAEGIEPSDFWVRVVRALVKLMQERTGDGYVFRTDLRLRPDPGATRLAISAPAALVYYESMGQNWERAALIKARAAAGDLAAGEAFLRELRPFLWRKYLDFAAIADIHSIKRQVHAHRGHAAVQVLGHDIKRGRGGIREIEFFVQTQQLIAGGRDTSLRGKETRAMLAQLAKKGWIDDTARDELDQAYVFLRRLEHRLQMVQDEQTHTLPSDRGALARIGRLMGYADATAFERDVRQILNTVAGRYTELFESAADLSAAPGSLVFTGGEDDPDTIETLRQLGFADPSHVTETVRGWHFGRFAAMRSTAAREALTEITPALLQAFAKAGNPDAAVRAFDNLLRAAPAGAQLFAILRNNPDLLSLLATILSAAPRLAEIFTRRPHIVDAVLDPSSIGISDRAELEAALQQRLGEARSYEDVLDRARLFVAERRFLISVGLLNGSVTPGNAGDAFSDLAEAVVRALFERTLLEFERRHGRFRDGRSAVLAFGRLGSREMTAGSDLDLIIVYDHAPDTDASDGEKPLPPSQYFTRLTQRLVAALSAQTSEGSAYAVDLRLRPSGRSGPLATHIEAFTHYQLNEAWTWEHMAMSRGRAIAGDADLSRAVEDVISTIVAKRRRKKRLGERVASMRARVEKQKHTANPFDVKLAPGGLMDCEFAAQFLMLSSLGRVAGEATTATLKRATTEGKIPTAEGERLTLSSELQGGLLQVLRVTGVESADLDQAPDALKQLLVRVADGELKSDGVGEERAGVASFDELRERLQTLQTQTRAAVERVLGVPITPSGG
jgi:[glutamine synthetase] adenylyltransferase / [glutamine synthetase]-adenylyl-L-tyrosine phosphorylase